MSDILDWLDEQSIGVQSFVTIAFIIVLTTAVLLSLLFIIKFFGNLHQKKSEERKQKQNAEKMNELQENHAATKEKYLNAPITEKIVRLIRNDNELTKAEISFYHITLYYNEKEKTIYFYEWDFDSVPSEDFNRGFTDAVMERLGNNYSYEPSMNDTSGIITVVKGDL